MRILFNKEMLNYGINSFPEGSYRLYDFLGLEDTKFNGENFVPLIYNKKYIQKFKKSCERKDVVAEIKLDNKTYKAAFIANGLSVLASKQNDFAVIRPPGHHAGKDKALGFCFFNNIAIATKLLVDKGKKVCILDIDGHHGNGTQSIFYNSNKVLYCSIHQQGSFPGTGGMNEQGQGEGAGYNINIPIAEKSGDDVFLLALEKMLPSILKFNPDIVAVSAGFDGYYQDSLLNLNYSLNAYYECGILLRKNFNNVFAVLEGGYHNNIRKCVEVFIAGVNGNKIKIEEQKTNSDDYCHSILKNNTKLL